MASVSRAPANVDLAIACQRDGYAVLQNVVGAAVCDSLREHVLVTSAEAARLKRRDLFGNIQEARHRSDLKLDLCVPVLDALNSLIKFSGSSLKSAVGTDVRIVELAAITSNPGALTQPVHVDTTHGAGRFVHSEVIDSEDCEEIEAADHDFIAVANAIATQTAVILTSLTALQDIETEMGPTHVWPGTNSLEHHETLWRAQSDGKLLPEKADEVLGVPHKKMLLRKGDALVYDSRTIHCGGANTSQHCRSVLCVSFMGSGVPPEGTTWTMLPSLSWKLSLDKFPLSPSMARTGANSKANPKVLPPLAEGSVSTEVEHVGLATTEGRTALAPLHEWQAVAQCGICDKWRPCSANEVSRWAMFDTPLSCDILGFTCMQDQVYSWAEINESLN